MTLMMLTFKLAIATKLKEQSLLTSETRTSSYSRNTPAETQNCILSAELLQHQAPCGTTSSSIIMRRLGDLRCTYSSLSACKGG